MDKEYLDRKEVDNILTDIWDDEIAPLWEGIITATEEIRIQKSFDKLVTQICQLKPKNQEVIAELNLSEGLKQAKYDVRKAIEDNWQKCNSKKVKIILEVK